MKKYIAIILILVSSALGSLDRDIITNDMIGVVVHRSASDNVVTTPGTIDGTDDGAMNYWSGTQMAWSDPLKLHWDAAADLLSATNVTASGTVTAEQLTSTDGISANGEVFFDGADEDASFFWDYTNNILQVKGAGGNEGSADFYGHVRITRTGVPVDSLFSLSLQDDGPIAFLEILNGAGTGKGVFFGIEGTGADGDAFALYSWQGGPINFYTNPAASAGTLRFVIGADGTITSHGNLTIDLLAANADAVITMDGSGNAPGTITYTSTGTPVFTFNKDVAVTGDLEVVGDISGANLSLSLDGNATMSVDEVFLVFGTTSIAEISFTGGFGSRGSIRNELFIRGADTSPKLIFSDDFLLGGIEATITFFPGTMEFIFTGADTYNFDGTVIIGDGTNETVISATGSIDQFGSADATLNLTTSSTQTNWDAAYDNMVTDIAFNTGDGIITVTQQDSGTLLTDSLDGRYYTETELGSTSNGLGASLIGIEDDMSLYAGTDVEDALEEVMDQITIETHVADSFEVGGDQVGTVTGIVENTQVINDGDELILNETTGGPNPNFVQTFEFSGITAGHESNLIELHWYYSPTTSPHTISIQMYNYNTSTWDVIDNTTLTATGGTLTFSTFTIIDGGSAIVDYTSGGASRVRFSHDDNGVSSHDFGIDYLAIKDDHGIGSGITDHGSMSGLQDDDHDPLYHTDGRAATWLAANHETTFTHADIATNTTHGGLTNNPHTVTATQVGLGNVTDVATDDTAYDATSWDANADAATKNAIRDKIETMDTATGVLTTSIINFVIDGGGSVIATGVKGYVEIPFDCTITAARLFADQSGAIVIDVWKDTYANFPPLDADSITSSTPPTITASGIKSEDETLTSWTVSISAGDILMFNVDSVATIERCTLALTVTRTI